MRRFFRLAPCAGVYLLALLVIGSALHGKLGSDVSSCLLLFRNYVPDHDANAMTDHFWSLSIEEQFYLAWPCILVVARKRALGVAMALYFEIWPERERSIATSLSAFQMRKLGFFNPHWTYGTTKWVLAVAVEPSR